MTPPSDARSLSAHVRPLAGAGDVRGLCRVARVLEAQRAALGFGWDTAGSAEFAAKVEREREVRGVAVEGGEMHGVGASDAATDWQDEGRVTPMGVNDKDKAGYATVMGLAVVLLGVSLAIAAGIAFGAEFGFVALAMELAVLVAACAVAMNKDKND